MDIRDRIRTLRKALDEDVGTFGERFARSGRAIEDWEQGRRRPDALAVRVLDEIERRRARRGIRW